MRHVSAKNKWFNSSIDITLTLYMFYDACRSEEKQDYQTRSNLMPLLKDTEEDHMHWLEQQLGLIKRVGLQNYCQSQM